MLTGHHFQNAYIVADIDAAVAECAKRGGPRDVQPFFTEQELWTPQGMKRVANKLAFVWLGDLQLELIEVVDDQSGIYQNYRGAGEPGGGPLHFHHSCTRVADWDSFRAAVDQQDLPVVLERANPGDQLKFLYLDAREFCGHYLEYTWMTDEMWPRIGGPV